MPITKYKIYGERLSGTNYVDFLMCENFQLSAIPNQQGLGDANGGWKHGVPRLNKLNLEETLFVVIFRDIESWARSFYHEPWETNPRSSLKEFVTKPLMKGGTRYHDIPQDNYGKTLEELRNYKIQHLMQLRDRPVNVVYVHLTPLKQFGAKHFLESIATFFNLPRKTVHFIDSKTHVKRRRIEKREQTWEDVCPPLLTFKNSKEETFVQRLETSILLKARQDKSRKNVMWK